MNSAAFSAASGKMAPERTVGSLATTPTGRPSIRQNAVTISSPYPPLQLEHRLRVRDPVEQVAHVVGAVRRFRDQFVDPVRREFRRLRLPLRGFSPA